MNQAKTALSLLLALTATSASAQWSLEPLWTVAPGEQYLPAAPGDNNQRGMGYNPVTGHLLLTDRTGGTFIHVINAATGVKIGTMDTTGITGGTFNLNMLRVADDGAIYAANLTTDSAGANALKIYRWADESAVPTVAFSGDPSAADASATNRRFGDNFDVRGSGTGTQILMASRAGQVFSVFTTANGTTFSANKITSDATAGDLGLGVAFGDGDTIWASATGRPIREVSFDTGTGVGTVIRTIAAAEVATSLGPLGFDPGTDLLAGINLLTSPTKDAVVLVDTSLTPAVVQDSETFPLDVANANGVGSVEFANGNLYALDVNNGIMALRVVPEPSTYALLGAAAGVFGFIARRRK